MPDSRPAISALPIENHRPIEYAVNFHPNQAALFRVAPSTDGRKVNIDGICPGCAGLTTTEWTTGTGNGNKGLFRGSAAKAQVADRNRLVNCECGHMHANRPDSATFHGCGANWYVEIP